MRSLYEGSPQPGGLVAHLHNCRYEVLHKAVACCGYAIQAEGDNDDNWDLCWSDLSVTQERVSRLKSFQRLNHFPGMLEICRKASLSRHLARMYYYYPQSMVLPDQLDDLIVELKKNKAKLDNGVTSVPTYIIKPSGGTMGKGIALVQTLQHLQALPDICNTVAQLYVPNPLLLDGFKFDMRIYACVASIDPLRIFLYDEGLARLATNTYQVPSIDNLHAATMHLTNYAINRSTRPGMQQDSSTKRPASQVLEAVARAGNVSKASLVDEISAIVVKTVLAVQPLLSHTYHTSLPAAVDLCGTENQCTHLGHLHPDIVCPISKIGSEQRAVAQTSAITTNPCGCAPSKCFELLGFDIMFDDKLHPWLLEVNHSPSFACDTTLDHQVKSALLTDTVKALQQTGTDKAAYLESQSRALAERLYAPSSSTARKRPLSALPRNRQLQAAAVALDDMAAGLKTNSSNGNSPWHGTASPLNAESPWKADGKGSRIEQRQGQGGGILGVEGSCGLLQDVDPQPPCQIRAYRYTQIYPPQTSEVAQRFSHVLGVATDAFPDQRCQCAYCARRRESRLLRATWTSSDPWSASTATRGDPCGFGGSVRTPSGGHMFASANAGASVHRSQSAQRALHVASRPPSGRASTPRRRGTQPHSHHQEHQQHHHHHQQQQHPQQMGGGFAAWAGPQRPTSARGSHTHDITGNGRSSAINGALGEVGPPSSRSTSSSGAATLEGSTCSARSGCMHTSNGAYNGAYNGVNSASNCVWGEGGMHSNRSTSSSGAVTLEGSTRSLSSLPSSGSSRSSCSSSSKQNKQNNAQKDGGQHNLHHQGSGLKAQQCACGRAACTHNHSSTPHSVHSTHSVHGTRSRPSSATSRTPRPVRLCAHPFPDHRSVGSHCQGCAFHVLPAQHPPQSGCIPAASPTHYSHPAAVPPTLTRPASARSHARSHTLLTHSLAQHSETDSLAAIHNPPNTTPRGIRSRPPSSTANPHPLSPNASYSTLTEAPTAPHTQTPGHTHQHISTHTYNQAHHTHQHVSAHTHAHAHHTRAHQQHHTHTPRPRPSSSPAPRRHSCATTNAPHIHSCATTNAPHTFTTHGVYAGGSGGSTGATTNTPHTFTAHGAHAVASSGSTGTGGDQSPDSPLNSLLVEPQETAGLRGEDLGGGAAAGAGSTSTSISSPSPASESAAVWMQHASKQGGFGAGAGGGISSRPSSAGSLSANAHHSLSANAHHSLSANAHHSLSANAHHTPPKVPRVAGLPTRRQRAPGPVLDTELVAMRVHLLSNRFVSPLLLQHQWQQRQREQHQKQETRQRRASINSGSGGMSSKVRPASAQEPSRAQSNLLSPAARSTSSESIDPQAANAHGRSISSNGAEGSPNPWLARARKAFQEREAAEAAAAASASVTDSTV